MGASKQHGDSRWSLLESVCEVVEVSSRRRHLGGQVGGAVLECHRSVSCGLADLDSIKHFAHASEAAEIIHGADGRFEQCEVPRGKGAAVEQTQVGFGVCPTLHLARFLDLLVPKVVTHYLVIDDFLLYLY